MRGGEYNPTMLKTRIDQIDISQVNEPLSDCHDELTRELTVRTRIYDDWVAKGRMSYTEARDRYLRHASACKYLAQAMALEEVNAAQKAAFDEAQASFPGESEANAATA